MADNVTLPGTGQVVATKEIGGIEYQIMLLADGTYTIVNPATAAKQDLLLTELQLKADLTETQPVSMAAIPTGAATSAKQLADNHNVTVSNQPTGFATSAKQLPDGHEVEVNNLPADYPLPASQIVTLTPPAAITGFATSAKQLADNHQVQVSNQITGYATSAKQLADGHNVAVSNMIPAVETGLAKATTQTDGSQRGSVSGRNIGKTAQVSPMRALSVFDQIRLCGTPFHGTTKDPNFWAETGTTANGSITQAGGQVVLTTTADSGSAAIYTSTRTGRYISGSSNKYRSVIRLPDLGSAANNNVRNWGCFTAADGFMFQLNAATFNIVVRKTGTVDQVIPKASWTGTYAAAFTLDTNVHTYEIQYTNSSAWFFIDDNIVHTVKGETAPSTATLFFPVAAQNINTGIGPAVSLNVRTMAILRMGHEKSIPTYKNITTSGGAYPLTTVCKYGQGHLHRIVVNNPTAQSQTAIIVDNYTGTTPLIATIELKNTVTSFEYNCPFFTGLTIITSAACNITCVYE